MTYIKRPCDNCGRQKKDLYRTKIGENNGYPIYRTFCVRCRYKLRGTRPIKRLSEL